MVELIPGVYLKKKKQIKNINRLFMALAFVIITSVFILNILLSIFSGNNAQLYNIVKIIEMICVIVAGYLMVYAIFVPVNTGRHYLIVKVVWNQVNIRQFVNKYIVIDTIVDGDFESTYKVVGRVDADYMR